MKTNSLAIKAICPNCNSVGAYSLPYAMLDSFDSGFELQFQTSQHVCTECATWFEITPIEISHSIGDSKPCSVKFNTQSCEPEPKLDI